MRCGPLEDAELVPEREDLKIRGALGAPPEHDEIDQERQDLG